MDDERRLLENLRACYFVRAKLDGKREYLVSGKGDLEIVRAARFNSLLARTLNAGTFSVSGEIDEYKPLVSSCCYMLQAAISVEEASKRAPMSQRRAPCQFVLRVFPGERKEIQG